jgi:hypothetical protein
VTVSEIEPADDIFMPGLSLVALVDAAFAETTVGPGGVLALGWGLILAIRDADVPGAECGIKSRVCIHTFRESNG